MPVPGVRWLRAAARPLLLLPLAGLACGGGASTGPSSGCTSLNVDALTLIGVAAEFTAQNPSTLLVDQTRSYYWEVVLNNLCVAAPESQNHVSFDFNVEPGITDVTATGYVYAATGFQPLTTTLTKNGQAYRGLVDAIGLRQGSHDGLHGSVFISLQVSFPTRGTATADLNYVKSFMDEVLISWHFETLTP